MRKIQSGMTLLEVLVAMTLMVIISAIAYAGLNGLVDAKIHTDAVASNIRQELLTTQQLNKDIRAMIHRPVRSEFGDVQAAIKGDYSSIEFSKNSHENPLKLLRSDLQRVHWYLNDGKLFRRTHDLLDLGTTAQWQSRQYLDDVAELNINYVNVVGQRSRVWPLENSRSPLKYIEFTIVLKNDTVMTYFFRPII